MEKTYLRGNWNILKGKLKQHIALLIHNDLMLIKGKEEEVTGRLQKKISEIREVIHDLTKKLKRMR